MMCALVRIWTCRVSTSPLRSTMPNTTALSSWPAAVLAADKCFVDFDRLAGAAKRVVAVHIAHILADQIAHAPSRLVRDAELTLDLLRRDAIPRRAKQVHHVKPIPQRRPGAFEWRSGSRIDLIAAMLALE